MRILWKSSNDSIAIDLFLLTFAYSNPNVIISSYLSLLVLCSAPCGHPQRKLDLTGIMFSHAKKRGTRISSLNGIKSGHFSSIYIRTHCTGGHKLAFLVVVIMDDPVDEPERRFGTYHFPGAFGTSQIPSAPLNSSLLLSNDGDVNDP